MQRVFLTVGSQMPFDRLTLAVARWARDRPGLVVHAQIGHSNLPRDDLQGLRALALMAPAEYRRQAEAADLLVAHAGMGSVLTAIELDRPLVVMPRRGPLGETRNDHQVDTAQALLQRQNLHQDAAGSTLAKRAWIDVARDTGELPRILDEACLRIGSGNLTGSSVEPEVLSPERLALIAHLRGLICPRSG